MSNKKASSILFEQWVLTGILVLISLGFLLKGFFDEGNPKMPSGKRHVSAEKFDQNAYQNLHDEWNTPKHIAKFDEHQIFRSRLIVYDPVSDKVEPAIPGKKGADGITIDWKTANGYPIDDPAVAEADTDGDGFNNKEEFLGKTDPRNAKSHPDILYKLKIVDYRYVPFRFQFMEKNTRKDGTILFQINAMDAPPGERSYIVAKGGEVGDYLVGEYREILKQEYNSATNMVVKKDLSELDLIDQRLKETITLVRQEVKESNESWIRLSLNIPAGKVEPSRVSRGEKFKVFDKEYQLVRPGADQAIIRDLKNAKDVKIPIKIDG